MQQAQRDVAAAIDDVTGSMDVSAKASYSSPHVKLYGDIRGKTMGVGTKPPDFQQSGDGNDEGNVGNG